jgi:hypothetical protein
VLQKFREGEQQQLTGYRWVDRSKGIVSIPITQAMQMIAQRGIPPSPPAPPNVYYPPKAASMLTGFESKVEPENK